MSKILGIIPARGQSKGISRKNIALLQAKPLIAWTLEVALTTPLFDDIIVSTDSEEIANVARQYGGNVPFMRPAEIAQDTTPDLPVYQHVLDWLGTDNMPDIVVWLRPTAPLRSRDDITGAVNTLEQGDFDCIRSITKVSHHPYWMKSLSEDNAIEAFIDGHDENVFFRRQMLPPLYYLNGVVDVVRCSAVIRNGKLFAGKMGGYVIPEERCMDIDTPLDLKLVEAYLESVK